MQEVSVRERSGSWLLWFAVLAGPIAWAIQLVVNYSLEEWFACSPSSTTPGEILGLGVRPFAIIVSAVLASIAAAAGLAGVLCWRRVPSVVDATTRRARWMSLAGIMNSVLYLILILVSFGPPLILGVCETSP